VVIQSFSYVVCLCKLFTCVGSNLAESDVFLNLFVASPLIYLLLFLNYYFGQVKLQLIRC
jgi:hypothetical protein